MKDKNKDPYNFNKTADFIREYDKKTKAENQPGGKIYMKRKTDKEKNEGRGE